MRKINFHPNRIKVTFNTDELYQIWNTARRRTAVKDSACKDKRVKKAMKNDVMHFIGLLGEYAFEKVTGYELDKKLYKHNPFSDFTIYGKKIEVKTRPGYLNLQLPVKDNFDIIVLVTYKSNNNKKINHFVYVEGWTTRKDLQFRGFTDDFGYGKNICLQPADLHPISELEKFLYLNKHDDLSCV